MFNYWDYYQPSIRIQTPLLHKIFTKWEFLPTTCYNKNLGNVLIKLAPPSKILDNVQTTFNFWVIYLYKTHHWASENLNAPPSRFIPPKEVPHPS